MTTLSKYNIWAHEQYGQVLKALNGSHDGLTLRETTSKVHFPTCKMPYKRVNEILRDLRKRFRLVDYDIVSKKYHLKEIAQSLESFVMNREIFDNVSISKITPTYVSSTILIFNHDPQINTFIQSNKKYQKKIRRIIEQTNDILADLKRLRDDVLKNEDVSGYGLTKTKGFGLAGSLIAERNKTKSAFTIVGHTVDTGDIALSFF